MTKPATPSDAKKKAASPVTIGEFRARLAEMIARAEAGEEVVIARGDRPVAKLAPLADSRRRRRLGTLKDYLSEAEIAALTEAIDKPLSPEDQAALEGALTDEFGIAKR